MNIRLGSHPNNLSLFILRHRGTIELAATRAGWHIEWFDYQQGALSGEWLETGNVDVVGTGSTPPIIAHSKALQVAYLGSSPPRNNNCALLTLQHREISSLRHLRLAGMPGSFTDHFLARLLHKEGLRYEDITLLDLQGQPALDALLRGDIDGWLAIDPWLNRARTVEGIQTRSMVGEEIINRSLFWTRANWKFEHPDVASWIIEQLRTNDEWIEQNISEAAEILAKHLNPGILPLEWQKTLRSRPWGVTPSNSNLLIEQQKQADDLFIAGFISEPLSLNPGSRT